MVVEKVREGKDGFGFNAATGEYEDLIKAGVIDPKKVARIALQNAASVASLLLTTECAIAEKPEPQEGHARHARYGRHGRHGRHVLSHGLAQPSQPLAESSPRQRHVAGGFVERGNLSKRKVPSPSLNPTPLLPKTFTFIESLFATFS